MIQLLLYDDYTVRCDRMQRDGYDPVDPDFEEAENWKEVKIMYDSIIAFLPTVLYFMISFKNEYRINKKITFYNSLQSVLIYLLFFSTWIAILL